MHATRTIADVMTRGAHTLSPDDSVIHAAQAMEALDVGALPVCDAQHNLVGLVTDRDIVLRAVAPHRLTDTLPLTEVMSHDVLWCYEDEPVDDVLDDMVQHQIRRLPVMDRQKNLVGMVSLGDVAAKTQNRGVGEALAEISLPAAPVRAAEGVSPDSDNALPEVRHSDMSEVNLGRS
ncbi:CBS domain-containing protein [Herbaspirillum rubrisubalbicans]|uniref:CBS domain-containing protein n=1 Tax=Herbaspirillum rubrisubalbicans Os34 TaxID=1235827 RepID=A0A6M3ZSJ4_9BURK|nr:CBS domain-containing protein [Herbaspirillum rubrisubalbicans]QJQ01361.1 CBS domain-containing protein [Herbaspirillum rubrisubalbicans Os34]